MADIGWITGHSYIVYGPLAIAATSVLYEGVPTYPDAGRPWRLAERLGVTIFHTAPTAVHAAKTRSSRTPQVQVPFQIDDDGRRAHRTGGVALVLRRGRQARSRDYRYMVDDRNRRLSRHDHAGDSSDEAGQLRPRRAGDSSGHL